MKNFSRREFLQNSSKAILGASLIASPVSSVLATKSRVSPNDKIGIGVIGCKGMGFSNFQEFLKFPEVAPIALCDIDDEVLNGRAKEFQEKTGKKPKLYKDFRKLLENKDIDAVIIGTPDHWHCLNMVYACEAGKDVYVEKPLANSIEECNIMLAAARKYKRVVQVGQWQRSGSHWKTAMDYIHSGALGNISLVKTWIYSPGSNPLPIIPDEPVPAGVDFDMWLGPAPQRSFNRNRFHGSWRYFWDYGGGLMTDWGVHLLDIAFYGMNAPLAKSAIGTGGMFAFPKSSMETPDTQQAIYEFDKFNVIWEHGMGVTGNMYGTKHHGIAFIGSEGTLVIDREKWDIIPEIKDGQYRIPKMPYQMGNHDGLRDHVGNFLECMKTRNKPNADIEIGRNVAINAHMGNIALRTGNKVYWDEKTNKFLNNQEANNLIRPNYRGPWKLPMV